MKVAEYIHKIDESYAFAWYIHIRCDLDRWDNKVARENVNKMAEYIWYVDPEVLRLKWIVEYRLWNRSSWIDFIEESYKLDSRDAATLCDLIEMLCIENVPTRAKELIEYYKVSGNILNYAPFKKSHYDDKVYKAEEILLTHAKNKRKGVIQDYSGWETEDM